MIKVGILIGSKTDLPYTEPTLQNSLHKVRLKGFVWIVAAIFGYPNQIRNVITQHLALRLQSFRMTNHLTHHRTSISNH